MATGHSAETKAAALAQLASGASISAVARQFGISRRTVTTWRDAAGLGNVAPVSQQKRVELGEQLYGYLEESIATLVAQLRFARDPNWLARQNAADLAIFMGVAADKTTRLLAAFRPTPDAEAPAVIDIPGAIEAPHRSA